MAEKSKPKPKPSPKGARVTAKPQPGGKKFYTPKAAYGAKFGGGSVVVGDKYVVIDGKRYAVVEVGPGKPAPRTAAKSIAEIVDAVAAARILAAPADPPELDDLPRVPTKAEIEAVADHLAAPDRAAFAELRGLAARHLGSHAAARVWLKSMVPGLEGTPLDAVKAGRVTRLLTVQKEQWEKGGAYT